tara:strand:+ start:1231 stop:1809 length:579 start_codon:yes stop_codon:yes gene_type:complete
MNHILASKSPRRKKILKQIGFKFSVIPSKINESFNIELSPEDFTEYWAREKAKDLSKIYPDSLIIGADTIVVKDSIKFGKPKTKDESILMLQTLSGNSHDVITGVSLIHFNNGLDITFNEKTKVYINSLSNNDILKYIRENKPYDKAGSYGIQDGFCIFINKIKGCYYNVMGLPISSFYMHYKKALSLIKMK